jgi:hypothetical protein
LYWWCSAGTIDISQYRLLFGFFLLYTDRVPFELLDSAAEMRWRGENSISNFGHHYINGGAVEQYMTSQGKTCKLNLLMRYLWPEHTDSTWAVIRKGFAAASLTDVEGGIEIVID